MKRKLLFLTLTVSLIPMFSAPVSASTAGRRNTAIGATALAIHQIARGNTGTGLLAAAGAGVAWNRYEQGRRAARRRSNCQDAFNAGFRAGVRKTHKVCYPKKRR